MPETVVNPLRFERAEVSKTCGSSKIRNHVVLNRKAFIGDFVSRIWAHYGPPDEVGYEGFTYVFRDKETGLIFTAYSAGSGPAYGGFSVNKDKLLPVLDAFDVLLEDTTPADCQIEYETDFGLYRSGARNGKPFDERIEDGQSEEETIVG
jgi:hypothetical protein